MNEHTLFSRTIGLNVKNPPKIKVEKIVKLTDHANACNSLTKFEYEVRELTRNGIYVNLMKLVCENS